MVANVERDQKHFFISYNWITIVCHIFRISHLILFLQLGNDRIPIFLRFEDRYVCLLRFLRLEVCISIWDIEKLILLHHKKLTTSLFISSNSNTLRTSGFEFTSAEGRVRESWERKVRKCSRWVQTRNKFRLMSNAFWIRWTISSSKKLPDKLMGVKFKSNQRKTI